MLSILENMNFLIFILAVLHIEDICIITHIPPHAQTADALRILNIEESEDTLIQAEVTSKNPSNNALIFSERLFGITEVITEKSVTKADNIAIVLQAQLTEFTSAWLNVELFLLPILYFTGGKYLLYKSISVRELNRLER